MPDRIIRDELLRSHRFVGLSSDTIRFVFIAFVLCADDLGNAEATPTAMGIMLVRSVSEEMAAKWLAELADVDLVRVYEANGKRYVHIPRYRQRLRYTKGKHPRPPENLECREIKALSDKVRPRSGLSQTTVSPKTAEVKRSEVKRSTTKHARANAEAVHKSVATNATATPQVKTVLENLTVKSEQPQPRSRHEQLAYVAAKIGKK